MPAEFWKSEDEPKDSVRPAQACNTPHSSPPVAKEKAAPRSAGDAGCKEEMALPRGRLALGVKTLIYNNIWLGCTRIATTNCYHRQALWRGDFGWMAGELRRILAA